MRKLCSFLLSLLLFECLYSKPFIISTDLEKLLELTDIQCERSLSKIVEATQQAWLRPAGKERWEVSEKYNDAKQREIFECCKRMGLLDEVRPKNKNYHYCCILGAALPTVALRLTFAAKLWQEGITFHELVFLTGDRPLDERIDHVPYLRTLPENETDGMKALYEAMLLPEGFRRLPLTVVNAPKRANIEGVQRPTTYDTLIHWLKDKPKPGTSLFVSNQPYVAYQNAVVGNAMPAMFTFETVGCATKEGYFLRASLLLDTLARFLYQENERERQMNQ